MTLFFVILILLACVALGFIVLIQNPKGGGLAGNVAGLSNQFMGVKQTTDVLEKGTWIFAAVIAVLCLISALFVDTKGSGSNNFIKDIDTKLKQVAPSTVPSSPTPTPSNDTTNKSR